jgi:hypothetical protein
MGKHRQKRTALKGSAEASMTASATTTKLERAPDPFPIFRRRGTPDNMDELDCNIEHIADQIDADLLRAHRTTVAAKSPKLRPTLKPEDARFLAYALIVHRTRRGGVLTEGHLRLLHSVLSIKRPSLRAAEAVGMSPVKDPAKFLSAADLQAREPTISENCLATKIGVDRKTIRAWRRTPEFKQRVRATRYLAGNLSEEDQKIKEFWIKAFGRRRGITS